MRNLAEHHQELLPKDTEARLLDAAGQVFAEKGFAAATVRDVSRRAGLRNVGAVNYYFRSKENLYEAALRHAFRCRMAKAPPPVWPEGTPPTVKLRQFIERACRSMLDDDMAPWQMQLLMRELSHPGPAGEAIVHDFIKPLYEILWGLLREVLPGPVDERTLHLIGFSVMGQCFYHRIARSVMRVVAGAEECATYDPASVAAHVARFSLAALGLDV